MTRTSFLNAGEFVVVIELIEFILINVCIMYFILYDIIWLDLDIDRLDLWFSVLPVLWFLGYSSYGHSPYWTLDLFISQLSDWLLVNSFHTENFQIYTTWEDILNFHRETFLYLLLYFSSVMETDYYQVSCFPLSFAHLQITLHFYFMQF